MSTFTKENRDLLTQKNSFSKSVSVRVDSKGRISIPSFLRKNFNLKEGVEVRLVFDLRKDFFIVQNSVADSIEVCGTSGAGSTPASEPLKSKRSDLYDR